MCSNYEKNQKILVGYGLLAETSVMTPISRDNGKMYVTENV